jgi:thiamine biosynthesis lipoprotein
MISLEKNQNYFVGRFNAMASPCELLIDTPDENIADQITNTAADEAKRIEQKFSRYRKGNIIHQINLCKKTTVDNETARLLDYASKLFELSDGLFDITAGVLRRAWKFDASDKVPEQTLIDSLLPLIGWDKVQWNNPCISLPTGMEIDLGGIGKEYAVDRAAQLVCSFLISQGKKNNQISVLLNFGGDITVLKPPGDSSRKWVIGIDTGINGDIRNSDNNGLNQNHNSNHTLITVTNGGIATSGDSRRFLEKEGKRYGHVLNPRTGWPVENAPTSVTVAAKTCTEAGMLSTIAFLNGPNAESFLKEQAVDYWLRW